MNWMLICCMIISILLLAVTIFLTHHLKRLKKLSSNKDEEIAYLRITVNYLKNRGD